MTWLKHHAVKDSDSALKGGNLKRSYTGMKDLPKELQNIVKNIKAMGKGFNVTKDKEMLNLKTLYNAREDLHKIMHTDYGDAKINLAAELPVAVF